MKPLWAFLSLISLIAIVALLWRSPETRDRISSVILGQPIAGDSLPAEETPAEKPEKPAPKKPVKPVRRFSAPAPIPLPEPLLPVAEAQKPKPPSRVFQVISPEANVKADSAAVYSFNSPRSPVVRVLRKGDKVETNLEVIDSGGRWSLIQAEQLRSGFVRSENLERSQIASHN